jgi:hypothetical protein
LNDNIIDVDFLDIEKEVFLTAPDVAREVPTDEKRVRYWGDTFGDIKECGVYKIDGRKKYTKQTIRAFKLIQKLIDEKQFSHMQVRDYITKNGFEYMTDPNTKDLSKDLIGYNGLSSELGVEVEQKLSSFKTDIKNMLLEYGELLEDKIKQQVAFTVDEVVADKLDPLKVEIHDNLQEYKDSTKITIQEVENNINKKLEERDINLVEKLRDNVQNEKIKALEAKIKEYEEQTQYQGFFSKLFGKKK